MRFAKGSGGPGAHAQEQAQQHNSDEPAEENDPAAPGSEDDLALTHIARGVALPLLGIMVRAMLRGGRAGRFLLLLAHELSASCTPSLRLTSVSDCCS